MVPELVLTETIPYNKSVFVLVPSIQESGTSSGNYN